MDWPVSGQGAQGEVVVARMPECSAFLMLKFWDFSTKVQRAFEGPEFLWSPEDLVGILAGLRVLLGIQIRLIWGAGTLGFFESSQNDSGLALVGGPARHLSLAKSPSQYLWDSPWEYLWAVTRPFLLSYFACREREWGGRLSLRVWQLFSFLLFNDFCFCFRPELAPNEYWDPHQSFTCLCFH